MATFVWTGRSSSGTLQKGELVAKDRDAAVLQLRTQSSVATNVQKQAWEIKISIPGFGGGVTIKDLVIFTRQLATMIDAGLPLVQCLEVLSNQADNKVFGKAIGEVRSDVEAGSTYAEALRRHPKIFDDLYVNLVAAGEAGGILDTILNRLSKYMEKALKLRSQIKGAMFYPVAVVGVAAVVIAALMIWVIPTFSVMFSDMGGELPMPTQIVIGLSDFLKGNILYIIVGGIAFYFGFRAYYGTPKGQRVVDKVALMLPVFGDLIRKAAVAKFTRTLGTLISSGVPILEGMIIVAKTAGNKVIEEAIMFARQGISEGKTIAGPIGQTKVFPAMVVQMISVGETAGALDTMLSKIADFYEDEVDAAVTALTSLLEPLLMVFLGVTIGFIVIAMYMPIFKMGSIVG